MRIVVGMLVGIVLVLGLIPHSDAEDLSAQGSNLSDCANALPNHYSLNERYRICELRRARSLLYKGSSECTMAAQASDAPSACNLQDSAGSLPSNPHVPDFPLRPIADGNIGKVYGDRTFNYDGKLYRVTKTEDVQMYSGGAWETICKLELDDTGCTKTTGFNSRYREQRANRVTCEFESIRFNPDLLKMAVTVGRSSKRSIVETLPMNLQYRYYYCFVSHETTAGKWN